MKNTKLIYLSLILFHMTILSCEKEHEPKPDVIFTPDVTSLGIVPVAQYIYGDDTYNMRYSKDNRMIQLSGDNLSMSHNPLEIQRNGNKYLANFTLDKAGCATYFEEVRPDGNVAIKYHLKYDSNNYLVEIVEETTYNNSFTTTYIRRGKNGRIESTSLYDSNGELSETTDYNYGKNEMPNSHGVFIIEYVGYHYFLSMAGLTGRPSCALPESYVYTGYAKKGTFNMYGVYTYDMMPDNYVRAVHETVYIDDVSDTYTSTYVYKGLYLYD